MKRSLGTYTVTAALLVFCQVAHAKDVPVKGKPPYRIGFILSLTGPLAEFGEAIRNGVTLAMEEQAGIAEIFEPLYEDSRYDPKTSVLSFEKLSKIDRVDAVYVFGGPMSDTLSPIAERASVPMFSTEYDLRHTQGKRYVVRFCNNAEDYAEVLLKELRNRGAKNFAIVKVENQYHNTLSAAFANGLASDEKVELLANFLPGENDFRAVLPKLRGARFDALGVYLSPGMQNAFLKQLRSSGGSYQFFGTDSFESRQENAGVEELVEGALFANSALDAKFIAKYRKRFASSAQLVHAALAYEFTRLVGDLFTADETVVSAEEFISRFALTHARNGVAGTFHYRNTPETGQYFSFPIAVKSIHHGEAIMNRDVQALANSRVPGDSRAVPPGETAIRP